MGLRDFVEPGRVCFVNYGEDYGKLVVIVDMLDINRVLVDSPDKNMPRNIYPLKRLTLTKIRVDKVMRGCRTGTLTKLTKAQDTVAKFKKTPVAVKMAKFTTRKKLTDFERFQVMVLRKQRKWRSTHLNEKIPVKKVPVKKTPEKPAAPEKKVVPASPKGKTPKAKKQKTKKEGKGKAE